MYVVLARRSEARGEAARQSIVAQTGSQAVEYFAYRTLLRRSCRGPAWMARHVTDPARAMRLWWVSEQLCGIATATSHTRSAPSRYPPEQFGQLLWQVFVTPRPRPRYTFAPNRLVSWSIPLLLPARWLDRLIGRNFGLVRDQRQPAAQRPV
jgi:hypothetical protein